MQPSELYEEYKTQFINNCELLQITSYEEDPQQYQKLINENSQLLKHIAIQLCSLGSKMSNEENKKVSSLAKEQIEPFKKKFIEKKKKWESSGKILLENSHPIQYAEIQQNQKLSQCKKLLYEMEDCSIEMTENLNSQTQKLKNTTEKVKSIDKVMDKANEFVDRMITRENRRRYVTYFVLSMIIAIVGAFKLYYT